MATSSDPRSEAPPRPAPWAATARALRRFELLQLAVLLVVAAVAVTTAVLFGRGLLEAKRHEAREQQRADQLVDLRDRVRTQQIDYLQRMRRGEAAFDRTSAPLIDLGIATVTGLAAQERAGDPAEVRAIEETLQGLRELRRIVRTTPPGIDPISPRALADAAEVAGIGPRVVEAVNVWLRADRAQALAAERRSDRLTRRMMLWLPLGVGLVALAGVLVWRLFDRARSRMTGLLADLVREQSVLREIATEVASEEDPEVTLRHVARAAAELVGGTGGTVVRFDGRVGHRVGLYVTPGTGASLPPPTADLSGRTAAALVQATGAASVVADNAAFPDDPDCRALAACGHRSAIAAPVRLGGGVWGSVGAAGPTPFGPEAAERLERLADLVALAIENAESRRRLAARAATDPLTGLANHRTFQERLAAEVAKATAEGTTLALVVFDIDHFKEVNDAHGHQAGDRVLLEVSRIVSREARQDDLVARVGGEELAWIMPRTDGLDAWQGAERVRRRLAATRFQGVGAVTVSAGICDLGEAGGRGADLFRFADGALYWAKAHGRNASYRYSPGVVDDLSAEDRAERLSKNQALTALQALARAVDARDPSTHRHAERVAGLAARIAEALGWERARVDRLRQAGLMHDVGKLAVPDAILLKPGPLDRAEYEVVKEHSARGADIVTGVLDAEQVAWVRGHHERWDGGGYPDELAAEAIPEGARILALADAWDVMTGERRYSAARTLDEALAECRDQAGRQFWTRAVVALEALVTGGAIAADAQQEPRAPSEERLPA